MSRRIENVTEQIVGANERRDPFIPGKEIKLRCENRNMSNRR